MLHEDPWAEFEGNPPPVSQAMMREWAALGNRVSEIEDQLRLAQVDRDAVGNEIEELLLLGGGVEPGQYVARISGGRLTIGREEEVSRGVSGAAAS